jgi:hypothetical protein
MLDIATLKDVWGGRWMARHNPVLGIYYIAIVWSQPENIQ